MHRILAHQTLLAACCLTASIQLPLTLAHGAENLLPNASFESRQGDRPANWRPIRWGGDGKLTLADSGRTGSHALQITSQNGGDLSWATTVDVRPHAKYRLSGWIKTDRVQPTKDGGGRGALLNVHNMQSVATNVVQGTQDWTRAETVFDTGNNDAVQVNCLFGGWGFATGTAWFDDVQLELLSAEPWHPAITIDGSRQGHPISKYIYGQFIEHLGRCIYGGIWAEMLEDRKFYYPVTAHYAPYGDRELNRRPCPL